MNARAFMLPKGAESAADCQDRYSFHIENGAAAVSDGMSQSLFPKYWAEILAEKYTSKKDWFPSRENVQQLAPLWREKVDDRLAELRSQGIGTWRAENMLADGWSAGATLVGLRLSERRWRCDVLGDSCLVVVHKGRIQDICSSMDTSCFDNYPDYFDSDSAKPGKGEVNTIEGERKKGMKFLLVSDPLAAYLSSVRNSAQERTRINELLCVESSEGFERLVESWRKEGMHDDDTTLMVVW